MTLALALLLTQIGRPPMLERAEWKANPPVLPMKTHERKYITIHHGGVPAKPDIPTATKIKNLQTWSQREDKLASGKTKPQWPDVPYHYWIGYDGVIAVARDDGFVGDTNTEYDPTGHVLICVEGDFEQTEPTPAQIESVKKLALWLAVQYKIPTAQIQSHRDYSKQTTCPGKNLTSQMDEIRWYVLKNRK